MTESHYRSIIKGVTWRIVGTIDTIFLSFLLTGHLNTALKIGVTEVLTKISLYYVHERLWIRFAGIRITEKKISASKAVSWRIIGTIDTMLLGWYYTGNPLTGLKIGLTEVATKVVLFYFHERAWSKVPVGKIRLWFVKNDTQEA
jgi:uncharacterized membrane protein